MTRRIVIALVLAASFPADAIAHRMDEYLQAARLAVTPNSVRLELDLTPGTTIAASVVSRIDADHDGRFSPGEAESYARVVLRDVSMWLDEMPLDLRLQHVEVSTLEELLDGVGTISVVATTAIVPTPARHVLTLQNNHDLARGVYLMNALVPRTKDVIITAQSRDGRQQQLSVEYEVRSSASQLWWILAACVSVGTLGVRRLRCPTTVTSRYPPGAGARPASLKGVRIADSAPIGRRRSQGRRSRCGPLGEARRIG